MLRGSFSGWTFVPGPDGKPLERDAQDGFGKPRARTRPIIMTLSVTTVFKGEAPSSLLVVENLYDRYLRAEGAPTFADWTWPAEAGVCFGLSADPSGKDLLVMLRWDAQASGYRVLGLPQPFTAGLVADLAVRHPELATPRPPDAGNTATSTPGSNDWMFVSAIGGGMLLLMLVVALCVGKPR